jgi:hypothetical protein
MTQYDSTVQTFGGRLIEDTMLHLFSIHRLITSTDDMNHLYYLYNAARTCRACFH